MCGSIAKEDGTVIDPFNDELLTAGPLLERVYDPTRPGERTAAQRRRDFIAARKRLGAGGMNKPEPKS